MVITKQILINLYTIQKFTLRKIANKFNVTHVNILYLMKKFNIKRRTHSEAQNGRIHSSSTLLKMSLAKKGKPSSFKGKKQSKVSRDKII